MRNLTHYWGGSAGLRQETCTFHLSSKHCPFLHPTGISSRLWFARLA